MSSYDQFLEQKKSGFLASLPAMKGLESHLNSLAVNADVCSEAVKQDLFQFLKVKSFKNALVKYIIMFIFLLFRCLCGGTSVTCL